VREGKKELDRLQLHMRFQATRAPSTAQKLLSDLRTSPIPFLKGLVSLVLALVVFRLWRRWAKQAMPAMRQKFLTARPRTRANIRLAKFFWYLDRLRTPVEWLILLMVAASIIRPTDRFQDEDPVKLVVKWVFIGWAGLRLVDALVARGGAGRSRDTSGLRLRSLKLAWGWVAGSGLAMDLTDEYVGLGTLHSWSWWVFMALGVPVLLILLVWWKKTIFERLAREPDPPQMVQRLLARSAERQRYVGAALGGVFLLGRGIQREIVRFFSNFEVGRRVQAAIFRREVERQSSRSDKPRDPLPQHLQDRLLAGHKLVPKVYRDQVRSVVTRARGEQGWAVALVGERGMGKSTFLSRVASELDEQILVVDCPLGGFDHFYEALLDRLGLAGTHRQDVEILRAALNEHGIKVIALDNAHRLAAPMIGGFVDYGRAFEMIRELGGAFSWISTFDRIAFQFIKSARAEGALTAQEIVLPKWTEEQIGELLTVRAEAAGIEPSYDQLELPRQLDEASYEAEGDRKRHGYNRVLWDTSQGNPGVALRMWCDTLGLAEDGSVEVVLRSKRTVADLDDLSLTSQFVLRCLVQMEYASLEDVIRALNLPAADVEMALHAAHARGLVEDQDGVFSIAWTWYRLITRLLTRQNLLAS
jgi:hypothetical protein